MSWSIEGGRALISDELVAAPIHIRDGHIADAPAAIASTHDAAGNLVLPGIIDVHGDAFERQIMPRPSVSFPMDLALHETDRQLVANGFTTAFHSVSVSWEPGLRSADTAYAFVDALAALRDSLACDTHLHIRWETFALDAVDQVLDCVEKLPHPILAFNDHTTGTYHKDSATRSLRTVSHRSGLTPEAYEALLEKTWGRRDEVPAAIVHVARQARGRGATLFAHDEETPRARAEFRAMGVHACEFPLNEPTARAARDAGEHTILGAPNVVRGGSHTGALDATTAVSDGLCSVLTSDYYYPAPLHAVFCLVATTGIRLPQAWNLISKNPAEAAGLTDRGTLAPGQRADVIVVDDTDPLSPRVTAAFVAGRKVFERH